MAEMTLDATPNAGGEAKIFPMKPADAAPAWGALPPRRPTRSVRNDALGKTADHRPLAGFDETDVGPVQVRGTRQFFLRPAFRFPQLADTLAERCGEGGGCHD